MAFFGGRDQKPLLKEARTKNYTTHWVLLGGALRIVAKCETEAKGIHKSNHPSIVL